MSEPDLRRATLPNGLVVAYASRAELTQFYEDIFERRAYLAHGLSLADGACVFDVGANIGMFTLFADLEVAQARIFAFEPAPPLFEILAANTAWCRGEVLLFPCGLADRPGSAELTFYPASSGLSSFHPDAEEERAVLRLLFERSLVAAGPEREEIARSREELLDQRLRAETVTCPLSTLSEVVRAHGVERIDLLKVDVEKSEEAVLAGLAEEDWPKVRQAILEVHDRNGRLRRMTDHLAGRGFAVEVEQEELYRGTDRHLVYARRRFLP
jgi:phthiocerol/phenolphthiocerol synthesis type-I polyketide synthase E